MGQCGPGHALPLTLLLPGICVLMPSFSSQVFSSLILQVMSNIDKCVAELMFLWTCVSALLFWSWPRVLLYFVLLLSGCYVSISSQVLSRFMLQVLASLEGYVQEFVLLWTCDAAPMSRCFSRVLLRLLNVGLLVSAYTRRRGLVSRGSIASQDQKLIYAFLCSFLVRTHEIGFHSFEREC